ncbi:hypothetical protein CHS0354_002134 [Potamilus streckersoni]|uniref:VWFA domain-containing protein n=1 Tax=Potamilus streckersoni TaxID=2493646 RepID=A0AAE0TEX8_9BIVA|nr:hypothetical protein CHS0354_002134 [Potamilus streckersoni]
MKIGVTENHIAMMTFSTRSHVEWNFNKYADKQALINATLHIHYVSGTTNTAEALLNSRMHVFTPVAGDRHDFPNVAIILTDGKSDNHNQTTIRAAALQHVAKVIAIGVGSDISINELNIIATDPDQQNVLLSGGFHDLHNLLTKIGSVLC